MILSQMWPAVGAADGCHTTLLCIIVEFPVAAPSAFGPCRPSEGA